MMPSDDELRRAVRESLKGADFNTTTLQDILDQVAQRFNVDAALLKQPCRDVINEELAKPQGDLEEDGKEDTSDDYDDESDMEEEEDDDKSDDNHDDESGLEGDQHESDSSSSSSESDSSSSSSVSSSDSDHSE